MSRGDVVRVAAWSIVAFGIVAIALIGPRYRHGVDPTFAAAVGMTAWTCIGLRWWVNASRAIAFAIGQGVTSLLVIAWVAEASVGDALGAASLFVVGAAAGVLADRLKATRSLSSSVRWAILIYLATVIGWVAWK